MKPEKRQYKKRDHRNLFKNKDGRWVYDVTIDGKRYLRIRDSKIEAQSELEDLRSQHRKEKIFGMKKSIVIDQTFRGFAEEFIKKYAEINKRSSGRDRQSIKHLNAYFKNKSLSEISSGLVEGYKAHRKSEKASNATINRELACLRTILYKAVEWGSLESYPLPKRKLLLKEENGRTRILTDVEARLLIEKAKHHLKPILTLLLNTGMRKSEALGLKWENVDFRKGFLYIANSKSGKPRYIPMNAIVYETLQVLKDKTDSGFIFSNPETKKGFLDIKRSFHTACKEAEIKGVTLHTLRHTAASRMVEAGVDLVTIKEILGHATIQMTMRYAHPTPENMRRAVEKLGVLFESTRKKDESGEQITLPKRALNPLYLYN